MKCTFSLLFLIFFLFGCNNKHIQFNKYDILTFRNSNTHSGFYSGSAIKHPDGFNWIFKTNGPVRSTPAVYNETVYFGSSDGNLYAVDLKNGNEKWKFPAGGAVTSSPAISGDKVFFSSRNGYFFSLDVNSGMENWRFNLGSDLPYTWGFDYYISSPVIENKIIYIGSGNGKFYSIDADNGNVNWEFNCHSRIRSTAAISDKLILFGDMGGRFYALNKNNGSLAWKFEVEGIKYDNSKFGFDRKSIMSSAAVSGTNVVFGSRDGNLYDLNILNGKEIWKVSHGTSWIISSPAIYDGVIYVGSSDARFEQAVDLKTGKEIWKTNSIQAVWSSPAVTENSVCFGDFSGTLFAVDKKTGKENWNIKLMNSFIVSSPVVINEKVLIGGDDGNLYCIKVNAKTHERKDIRRAVYWEKTKSFNWFQNGVDEGIRDYFKSAGYEVLNENSLAKFLNDQIKSKALSVVIFASNKVPFTVFDEKKSNFLIKDYLNNNGKIVFLGANPLAYVYDKKSRNLTGIDFRIPSKVFGVDYEGELTDALKGWFYAKITPDGQKWGLAGWWVGIGSVSKDQVNEVLAKDENGNAAAWIKNFGGPEGTGLVQLWVNRSVAQDYSPIKNAAEYGF
jgi:outer membrane protein assembly factor BamB